MCICATEGFIIVDISRIYFEKIQSGKELNIKYMNKLNASSFGVAVMKGFLKPTEGFFFVDVSGNYVVSRISFEKLSYFKTQLRQGLYHAISIKLMEVLSTKKPMEKILKIRILAAESLLLKKCNRV